MWPKGSFTRCDASRDWSPDRSADASHMHSHVYNWSRDLFSSVLFVPLAATGCTNSASLDDRLDVRSSTDRATKNQTLTGDLRCIARCVGHSNCPVYTVRSGRFRSIGRCIAPCKWVLKLLVNLCMPFDFILIDELLTKTFYHPEQR